MAGLSVACHDDGALNVADAGRPRFDHMQDQGFQTCDGFVTGNYEEQQTHRLGAEA
jgi:hypothetical protein